MTAAAQPRIRLTPGEWLGVVSLAVTLIGGLIEMRVQVATLRSDVAAIRHDLDWIQQKVARHASPPAPQAAPRGKKIPAELSRVLSAENLVEPHRPSCQPAQQGTAVPRVCQDRQGHTGNRGGSHYSPPRKLAALLRRQKLTVTLSIVS